jgi:hypothetical protein
MASRHSFFSLAEKKPETGVESAAGAVAVGRGGSPSTGSSALFTEGHAGELLLEPALLL